MAGIIKELDYVTKLERKIMKVPSLYEIYKKIQSIDFIYVYHQDNEDLIFYLDELNEELSNTKDKDRRQDIREKIRQFDPPNDSKIEIIISHLLKEAEGLGYEPGIINGLPHVYNGYFWEACSPEVIQAFLSLVAERAGFAKPKARKTAIHKQLYEQFKVSATIPQEIADKKVIKINFQNGTGEVNKGNFLLRVFSKDDSLTYQLPFEYDPKAECPLFTKFLDEVVPEKEARMVIAEYIGYILTKDLKLEKCLVLVGAGANGKSVLGDIISALLGPKNVTAFSLSNLCEKSGYYRAEMGNFLLSYSSEMGGRGCDPDLVKQLISNEPVNARSPYGKPFTVTNYCRFLFNTNLIPRDVEQSHGYYRRLMYLEFDKIIPEDKQDKRLAEKIIEKELSGIFNWVLEGLKRLIEQEAFTRSPKIENAVKDAKLNNDSVALFINENGYIPSTEEYYESTVLYPHYVEYCRASGYMNVNKTEFLRRLEKSLGFYVKRRATNNATWIYCECPSEQRRIEIQKETGKVIKKAFGL